MKQFFFQILALAIVIFVGFYYSSHKALFNQNLRTSTAPVDNTGKKLSIVDENLVGGGGVKAVINIELADTQDKRTKGLGGKESLASDSGMLFIFDRADKYKFWMKGLKFPLDLIWINNDEIVDINANVPIPNPGQTDDTLPLYSPMSNINKVLEVNGGFALDKNIKIGDKITIIK